MCPAGHRKPLEPFGGFALGRNAAHLPTSRPHYISITDRYGQQIRGTVVYIQPKAERWREQMADVHITCSEWIEPYWHTTVDATGKQPFGEHYMPYAYELGDKQSYLFKGTFERTAVGGE